MGRWCSKLPIGGEGMREFRLFVIIAVGVIALAVECFSGDAKTKAAAKAAVAQALAEVADTQPPLNANVQAVDQAEIDRLRETAEQQAREIERFKADFVPRPPTLLAES